MKTAKGILAALTLISFAAALQPASASSITIFAAASLSDVIPPIARGYESKTHDHVTASFAASSALARQIAASSGADIFISADTNWMDYLQSRGLILPGTRRNLLGNTLVLVAPAGSAAKIKIADHFPLLADLHGGRLSMAEPQSVPAGLYGRAALISLGVWDSVKNHIAAAENVRVALAYVARKEAPLGIVYRTDALSEPRVTIVGAFPEGSHKPIVYPTALIKDASPRAKAFLTYLSSPEARAIFEKAGFTVLGTSR